MKLSSSCFFIFLFPVLLHSQSSIARDFAGKFLSDLVHSPDSMTQWIDRDEIKNSSRLGISYSGISQKFFIGYGIPDTLRNLMLATKASYEYDVTPATENYSILTCSVPQYLQTYKYYFKGTKCISPAAYYSGQWKEYSGRYIVVRASDTTSFNLYSLQQLDMFIERVGKHLGFTKQEMEMLGRRKILYLRCRDENEIEKITGFKTMGMALLNVDAVASLYNSHYHELVHLLINYKLKHLPLYTHPFFQEGAAVALGGRGGKEPGVLFELGRFIAVSGFEMYTSLLDPKTFRETDASISYALSGTYNMFLLREAGSKRYQKLYREFSASTPSEIPSIPVHLLPPQERWARFLDSMKTERPIRFDAENRDTKILWKRKKEEVLESKESYIFHVRDSMEIISSAGEKIYSVSAGDREIRIVNERTGNLAANFVQAFSFPPEKIPMENGLCIFSAAKAVFDNLLTNTMKFIVHEK